MSWDTQPFATTDQFELECGRDVLQRVLDENRDGYADVDLKAHYLRMGQSKIEGALRPHYALPISVGAEGLPTELTRWTLDYAKIRLWRRHREVLQWDPDDMKELWKELQEELKNLMMGQTRLNVMGLPDSNAKNKGGVILGDEVNVDGSPKKYFVGTQSGGGSNMGDF